VTIADGVWEVYLGRHRVGWLDLRQTHPGQKNVQVTYARPGGLGASPPDRPPAAGEGPALQCRTQPASVLAQRKPMG